MYIDFNEPSELASAITVPADDPATYLLMISDAHQHQIEDIIDSLNQRGITFYGAVFPGLLHGRQQKHSGAIIKQHRGGSKPVVISLKDLDASSLIDELPQVPSGTAGKPSLHVFVDCLAPSVSGFLNTLFNHYANRLTYFGGGAGNSRLEKAPCVFSNDGVFDDAAVLSIDERPSTLNVKHGWQRVEGPFIATRTEGSIIKEFNWEPALDVYRRSLPEALRDTPADQFFSKITPVYPFSIEKDGSEDIVRDPVGFTEEGGIVCISDVTENSVMYLVHGEQDKLIAAASDAVAEIVSEADTDAEECLVCDCFSRALLFGDEFERELDRVADQLDRTGGELLAEGALVLGEVASDGEQSLEFYNKTFVVSLS